MVELKDYWQEEIEGKLISLTFDVDDTGSGSLLESNAHSHL